MAQKQKHSWIGLQVQDCIVERLIGEGAYSWVYSGTRVDGAFARAFKASKPTEFIDKPESEFSTEARAMFTGGSMEITPDAGIVVTKQYEKLKATSDEAVVRVGEFQKAGDMAFYSMELLEGPSLRELMNVGGIAMQWIIAVADALSRLASEAAFAYHGDLKPDNIIFVGSHPKLFDPGYFGHLPSEQGNFGKAAITTRIYYPSLKPDDMFAFGIMLWELTCGVHPLLPDTVDGAAADVPPLRELDKLVKRYRATGNFNFNNFRTLPRPREMNPHMLEEMESVILKCLGMRVVDNRIELGEKYTDFKEVSAALTLLLKAGVDHV